MNFMKMNDLHGTVLNLEAISYIRLDQLKDKSDCEIVTSYGRVKAYSFSLGMVGSDGELHLYFKSLQVRMEEIDRLNNFLA